MRTSPPFSPPRYGIDRCLRCLLPRQACLCAAVPRVENATDFLIVRHAREVYRPSNTARVAALALARCTLRDYALDSSPFREPLLAREGSSVLWPEGPPFGPASPPRPRHVVVLDGTWSQCRRMLHRIPELATMPRLALPAPDAGRRRLRRPLVPSGMSTLEAIASAVSLLEGPDLARPLFDLHTLHAERSLANRRRQPPDRRP